MKIFINNRLSVILALFSVTLIFTNSKSQNLVQNPSFEDTIPCLGNPNLGGPETAPPWYAITMSPDYFNSNYCVNSNSPFGFQVARSGIGMVGFACTHPGFQGRETFSEPLIDTLIAGHEYCAIFYVSLAGRVQLATDGIAAVFTDTPMTAGLINSFTIVPQVRNPSGNVITDTLNWTMISDSFIAQGGEKYITIGNLFDDASIQVDTMPWGNPSPAYTIAYYYIDDVSVIDCTTGMSYLSAQGINPELDLVYSPQTQILILHAQNILGKNCNLNILDINGREIYSHIFHTIQPEFKKNISLAGIASGIYFVRLITEKETLISKFFKE